MTTEGSLQEILSDKELLQLYTRRMKRFDEAFCRNMFEKTDFTLKLEIHGDKGKVIHFRITDDSFERPAGSKSLQNKSRSRNL